MRVNIYAKEAPKPMSDVPTFENWILLCNSL
jgi:hypothetical protein